MASKDGLILIPGTYDYAALNDKRDFADVIKLRIWRQGDYPESSGWAQCNHKNPYDGKWEAGESDRF